MRTAEKAWLAMGAGIIAYEALCPKGELLSEGVDRALDKHPILTRALIGTTALHLVNMLPEAIDPFHHAVNLIKKTGDS